jgi:hypothetical protein
MGPIPSRRLKASRLEEMIAGSAYGREEIGAAEGAPKTSESQAGPEIPRSAALRCAVISDVGWGRKIHNGV